MKRYLWVVLILMVGCGGPWLRVGGEFTSSRENIRVEFPEKWMRLNTDDYLLITRDGVLLQNILIETIHVSDDLKHTKKKFKAGMLPQEAAEVILNNKSSNPEILNLKVLENNPAKIAGLSGFRVVSTQKNKDGLATKTVYYGFLKGELFYGISYSAAERYYFDQDIKTFEKVFKSFRLVKTA